MKHYLLGIFIVTIIGSCVLEELPISVEPAPVELVVSSRIHPGEPMLILLTRTFSALEGNEDTLTADFLEKILVSQAEVIINTSAGPVTLLHNEDIPGLYISGELLEQNTGSLTLIVNDTLEEMNVTAHTSILEEVKLKSFKLQQEIEDDDTTQFVIYEFDDPEEENWYVINVIDPSRIAESDETNPLDVSGLIYQELISDVLIENNNYMDSVRIFELAQSDTVIVYFANISEGYYRFLDAKQRSSFTGEPVNFPTNIIDGQGYFNAHNPDWSLIEKTHLTPDEN
ncbi:MAG: DUF4249 family protein [Reichenbachiella sp.]